MTVLFSLITGKTLPFSEGLASHNDSAAWKGLTVRHAKSTFGEIELQEYHDEYVMLRRFTIHWQRPERIVCKYNNPPGVYTRIALNKSLHEYIKGAGDIYLKKDGFSIITGSTWTGLLSALGPGAHHFIDIGWNSRTLHKLLNMVDPLKQSVDEVINGLPEKLITAPNFLNHEMRMLLTEITLLDFGEEASKNLLHNRLNKYFRLMIQESVHFEARKREMKEMEWHTIHVAKQYIENNLDRQITTADISRIIGINEYRLKKLFPKITGYALEEYRKYRLFVKIGKNILRKSDYPLKSFYSEAGYGNYSNFSKGFQKQCACTPAELRDDRWDLDGLPNYQAENDDE